MSNQPLSENELSTSILTNQYAISNVVSRALHQLSMYEKKLFVLAASMLKTGKNIYDAQYMPSELMRKDRTVTVNVKQFAEFTGISHRFAYKPMREAVQKLMTRTVSYNYETKDTKERRTYQHQLLDSIDYPVNSGTIQIIFNEDMYIKALQVKQNFNTYHLDTLCTLKSFYSFRLFELLNSHSPNIEISVQELRQQLSAPEKYSYKQFNQYVLSVAIKELHANELAKISIQPVKNGRTIKSIKFKTIITNQ